VYSPGIDGIPKEFGRKGAGEEKNTMQFQAPKEIFAVKKFLAKRRAKAMAKRRKYQLRR